MKNNGPTQWLSVARPAGVQEQAGFMQPLPLGPYILARQGSHLPTSWYEAAMLYELTTEFRIEYGYCTYAKDIHGKPQKIGYWYDTSD